MSKSRDRRRRADRRAARGRFSWAPLISDWQRSYLEAALRGHRELRPIDPRILSTRGRPQASAFHREEAPRG